MSKINPTIAMDSKDVLHVVYCENMIFVVSGIFCIQYVGCVYSELCKAKWLFDTTSKHMRLLASLAAGVRPSTAILTEHHPFDVGAVPGDIACFPIGWCPHPERIAKSRWWCRGCMQLDECKPKE